MATNKPRFLISVNDRMLSEIEQFQRENNFATRSGAIQELIRIGLEQMREEKRNGSILQQGKKV